MSYDPITGGKLSDQYPAGITGDMLSAASSTRGSTTVTSDPTPLTPGPWVQIDPSLDEATSAIWFTQGGTSVSATDSSTLLEIGAGGSGSEVVVATVPIGYASTSTPYVIPGSIPAGTRVAARLRSVIASQSVTFRFVFYKAKAIPPAAPTTYGLSTVTCRGVSVTAPGALNTKGAWTELVASTSASHGLIGVYHQGDGNTVQNAGNVLLDIGLGGSGSEAVLIGDLYLSAQNTEGFIRFIPSLFGVDIPAGSRLSARYSRSATAIGLDIGLVCA